MTHTQNHTDIINHGWVGKMPRAIRPYLYLMRLDRPIGTWLLLLPALWAITLSGGVAAWPICLLFAIGAIVMRGAGCVMNDIWDRDLDGLVERTATRPIPNGDVTIKQAVLFFAALLCVGFVILIQLNIMAIMVGVASLAFVIVYPLMKRVTWWPQAFLGLTFNFGALIGWAAVTGEIGWQAWTLYASGFFWTLGYDTIYALQDRRDDAQIRVKSSARWLTERYKGNIKTPLYGFYIIHYALLWVAVFGAGMDEGRGNWPMIGGGLFMSLLPFVHLRWQIETLSLDAPQNALKRFKSNRDYGLIIWAGIIGLSIFAAL